LLHPRAQVCAGPGEVPDPDNPVHVRDVDGAIGAVVTSTGRK
jgi:hypothetical protein